MWLVVVLAKSKLDVKSSDWLRQAQVSILSIVYLYVFNNFVCLDVMLTDEVFQLCVFPQLSDFAIWRGCGVCE